MKRLRNTGIYYTIFGILLAVSFIFFKLWRIAIVGILLLLVYVILRFLFGIKKVETNLNKLQLEYLDAILGAFPVFYVILTMMYISRPYRQAVVLPAGYEGVVAVQYDKPNGQEEKWIGGFLGIGASRLIEVDSTGIAETQFKFLKNAVRHLGIRQTESNDGGLKIYYENELDDEIVKGADGIYYDYENTIENQPSIYFTGFKGYPLIIFVVTKSENYYNYFMTEKEIDDWVKTRKEKHPKIYIERPTKKLKNNYHSFYDLKDYYYNKLR